MDNIEIKPRGSMDKIDTTVTIKMGTKHRLADLASKGESYDDVIARILHENERLKAENKAFAERLEQLNALRINRIDLLKEERIQDAVIINDELTITFGYVKPTIPVDDEYRMEITVNSYIMNGKKVQDPDIIGLKPEDIALIALMIITKVINNHFDSAFTLSRKANIIDTRYWEKVCNRVGLPKSSYMSDILPIIGDYERGLNDR